MVSLKSRMPKDFHLPILGTQFLDTGLDPIMPPGPEFLSREYLKVNFWSEPNPQLSNIQRINLITNLFSEVSKFQTTLF